MSDVFQKIFLPACLIMGFGVMAALFARFVHKQRVYVQHLPFMDGISLDTGATPPLNEQLARIRAIFERQSDPGVEQMRREVLWSFLSLGLGAALSPFLCFGVFAFLLLLGLMH